MTIAPPETREDWIVADPIDVLIREARRRTRRRRWASLGVATIVLLGTVALVAHQHGASPQRPSTVKSTDRTAALAPAPCTAAQLRGGLIGTTGGAGTFVELFAVENVSSHSCAVTGYPTLTFFSASGVRVAQQVKYLRSVYGKIGFNRKGALPSVTLAAHRGVASFWITEGDIPSGEPPMACHHYETIAVQPPGATRSLAIALQPDRGIYACTVVAVLPMMPGISGSLPRQNLRDWFGATGPTNDWYGPGLPKVKSSSG